jgi:3-hydroxyacyl-[acyl-carrier-protein] dehydratase
MKKIIDIKGIWKLIPHRHPILLVDGVTEYEAGKRIVATRYLREDNAVFNGHFPHFPLMPGVLLIEALAQTGAVMMALDERKWKIGEDFDDKFSTTMLGVLGESKMRFKRPVFPETRLSLHAEVDWQIKTSLCIKVKAQDELSGQLYASGQLTLTSVPLSMLAQHKPISSKPEIIFSTL